MKFIQTAVAVAAMALSAAAFAGPNNSEIAFSAGASATKNNLKVVLTNLCTTGGGLLSEFTSGGNISTYVCNTTGSLTAGSGGTYDNALPATFKKFAGTQFVELRLNVAAGSFASVRGLNGVFIDDAGADLKFRDPILNADRTRAELLVDRAGAVFVGGLSDVQPSAFPTAVTAGLTVGSTPSVGIAQAFGVAVSIPLYEGMFDAQKADASTSFLTTVAKPIPSTCSVTDTARPECVPTISKGQMAAIMSNNDSNAAYSNGPSFLASGLSGELRYIRRPNTSGTQAAAQNYFLGLPCAAVQQAVVDEPTGNEEIDTVSVTGFTPSTVDLNDVLVGAIRVVLAPGTGNVRQELSKTTIEGGDPNYAIGVMSGENNQSSGNSFRWLRVQGAPMSENAAPNNSQTNRVAVANGSYDFYFESVYAAPTSGAGVAANFWGPVSNSLKTLNGTGLVRAADQLYTKGGASCAASVAN